MIQRKLVKINQEYIKGLCRHGKVDILHSTWYDSYLLQIEGCKQVITIHDMIHERNPGNSIVDRETIVLKRRLLKKADRIIAVSEYTKKEILDIYPDIDEDKIVVIYNGGYIPKISSQCGMSLPGKYILYVGSRNTYKNFGCFVKAVKRVMNEYKDIFLVCVGGGRFTSSEQRLLKDVGERVMQINASDDELAYIYSHAEEFVFPSLCEGFGIPIIEAFSCKCPVVLSNASCFPEIAADAAIYFNPSDIEDMVRAMKIPLKDKNLCKKYIDKGVERARRFTWSRSAKETYALYQDMLS